MPIHAIIWDVGGVLVRTEDSSPRGQLAAQYGLSQPQINDLVFGTNPNHPAQLGEITHAQHWADIQEKLGMTEAEAKAFESRFFAGDVVDYNLIDHIRRLRKDYCTAILSNALSNLRSLLSDQWMVDDAFHQVIVSAEVGLMKPDPAIYDLTLETIGFAAEESVFIDDMPENIQAARDAGMHGIVFQSPEQAIKDLDALLAGNG